MRPGAGSPDERGLRAGDQDAGRTTFHMAPVYARRDNARVSALALDPHSQRLFLGLSTGYVEEFHVGPPHAAQVHARSLPAAPLLAAPAMRLTAGRKVSRHAVAEVVALHAAGRCVARTEEGGVVVCPYEGAAVVPLPGLPRGGACAIAGDASAAAPPARLAVAMRASGLVGSSSGGGAAGTSGSVQSRLCIYWLTDAGESTAGAQLVAKMLVQEAVTAVAWVGTTVVCGGPAGFTLVSPRNAGGGTVTIPAQGVTRPVRLASCSPAKRVALLFTEAMAVVSDATGAAVSPPVVLDGPPLALALVVSSAGNGAATSAGAAATPSHLLPTASQLVHAEAVAAQGRDGGAGAGMLLVAMGEEGVTVYDATRGAQLQTIPFVHDDAWIEAAQRMPCAEDQGTGRVYLATSSTVYCLSPVPLELQARELLKRRAYAAALALCDTATSLVPGAGSPPGWVLNTCAQIGLMLLLDARFAEACAVLLPLPVSTLQPALLCALFPAAWPSTAPPASWRSQLTALAAPHWSLHGTLLPGLEELVGDHLELAAATATTATATSQQQSQAPSLGAMPDARRAALLQEGTFQLAAYLLQARSKPGAVHKELIDTVLLRLLCGTAVSPSPSTLDSPQQRPQPQQKPQSQLQSQQQSGLPLQGCVGALEMFLSRSDVEAPMQEAVQELQAAGRWHALALMRAAHSHANEALLIWKQLAVGEVVEAVGSTAAVGSGDEGTMSQLMSAVGASGSTHWCGAVAAAGGDARAVAVAAAMRLMSYTAADCAAAAIEAATSGAINTGTARARPPSPSTPFATPAVQGHQANQQPSHTTGTTQVRRTATGSSAQQGLGPTTGPGARASLLAHLLAQTTIWTDAPAPSLEVAVPIPASPVPLEVLQAHLPWLLQARPGAALDVLCSRAPDIPAATALGVLSGAGREDDTRWRYLAHCLTCFLTPAAALPPPPSPPAPVALTSRHSPHAQSAAAAVSEHAPTASSTAAAAAAQDAAQGAAAWVSEAQAAGLTPDALCSELALELVECCSRELGAQPHPPPLVQAVAAGSDAPAAAGAGRGAAAGGTADPTTGSSVHMAPSTSGPPPSPAPSLYTLPGPTHTHHTNHIRAVQITSRLQWLRAVLMTHLDGPLRYDAAVVLAAVHATCPGALHEERVLLYRMIGDHAAALRLLAVELGDVDAAIQYCRQYSVTSQSQPQSQLGGEAQQAPSNLWYTLLELCLRPGEGRQPMYTAAVRVLHAPSSAHVLHGGGSDPPPLDPLQVLSTLPDDMPLHLAADVIAAMVAGAGHSRRQGQVTAALCRARNLDVRAQHATLCMQRTVVVPGSACAGCGLALLPGRVLHRLPSGVVLCDRCAGLRH